MLVAPRIVNDVSDVTTINDAMMRIIFHGRGSFWRGWRVYFVVQRSTGVVLCSTE